MQVVLARLWVKFHLGYVLLHEIDSYDWLHILKVSVARKSGLHQKGYGFLMQTAQATLVNLPHACEFSFL
jgi:hypothetical protein